ncbi:metallophosphatase [Nitratireductor aestuarii]|uniref:Metallophosphatase n=1 Tax=Nitratireductor aestuarii TaxID=1735103 RepID=A0A916W762_9HYPH|nr:metallophosphoesterase family protein [Nitratireductor aestuarii]GGA74277.1 metallophosphatase [Nitratireductor aestuarii]
MATEGVTFSDAKAPEGMRIYAIGDIHGRFDLLSQMHERIVAEIERDSPADWRIIYLGDYVDRGPESNQVLEFLSTETAADPRVIALAGNHDAGMLSFLNRPRRDGLFALYGGDTTAQSYGVELRLAPKDKLLASAAELEKAVPEKHIEFLRNLPVSASFGDLFFCHAGVRPGIPLEEQKRDDLLWIRNEFHDHFGLYPKLIVHGHTPRLAPEIRLNRVNLDTGAVKFGVLSCMRFEDTRKDLIQVSGS